jgi:hypothetical protein
VFEFEGGASITGSTKQCTVMWYPKYPDEFGFICGDPLDRRKPTTGAICALAWDVLLLDQEEDAGEKALEDIEHICYWGDGMPEIGKDGAMKDHLPLDTSVGAEEGRGMHGSLKAEIGGPGKAWRWVAFYGKEHAVVEGKYVPPAILLHELVTDGLQPPAGTGIIDANSVCAN